MVNAMKAGNRRLGGNKPAPGARRGIRERLDLLAEIASRLLKGDSPHEVVELLRPKLMAFLDCQIFLSFLMDDDNRLRLHNHVGIPPVRVPDLGCLQDGQWKSAALDFMREAGIKVYACEPLVSRQKVLGTFVFGSQTRRIFSHEEISFLRAITYHITIALERRDYEEQLRMAYHALEQRVTDRTRDLHMQQVRLKQQHHDLMTAHQELEISRNRFSNLYDISPLNYVTFDQRGIITEINLTGARLLGAERDTLIGRPFRNFLAREEWAAFTNHLMRCGQILSPMTTELRLEQAACTRLHVQLHSVPVKGFRPDEMLFRTAITDISELKKTEQKLLRLNRFYAVLCETDNAIIRASDEEGLFHDVCRVAVRNGGFRMVWIGMIDEGTGILSPVASCGLGTEVLDHAVISVHDGDRDPLAAAIRDGRHFISNDFFHGPHNASWREAGLSGIRGAAAIALKFSFALSGLKKFLKSSIVWDMCRMTLIAFSTRVPR